ncbi:hypothetical protein [Streptomyces sp. NPDC005435]|uniref:hypothetical protein n=1 Tax=Streptomyces sp. NPDC005435 TaxID=3154464 RepID=UPI003452191F
MSEFGFTRASDDVLAARGRLADDVVQSLVDAGLPAFRDDPEAAVERSGALVSVEPDAETASAAVSVGWRCSPDLLQAAAERLLTGDADAPAVRYPGVIGRHMQSALIQVLLTAGIIATPENDAMNPARVLVFGRMSDLPPALRPTFVPPGTRSR